MSTVLRLFVLPHKDSRQMFFVISLDPPIKQGQTRYHFLVLLFGKEDETSIELPFTEYGLFYLVLLVRFLLLFFFQGRTQREV